MIADGHALWGKGERRPRMTPPLAVFVAGLVCAAASVSGAAETNSFTLLPEVDSLLPREVDSATLFESWPSAAVLAKIAVNRLPASVGKHHPWSKHRKRAAFLPYVRAGYAIKERNYDRTILVDSPRSGRQEDLYLDDGLRDNAEIHAYLAWDLAELVYDSDVATAAHAEKEMEEFRTKLKDDVIEIYSKLKSAVITYAMDRSLAPDKKALLKVEIEKNTALLDARTDDYFSRYIVYMREKLKREKAKTAGAAARSGDEK